MGRLGVLTFMSLGKYNIIVMESIGCPVSFGWIMNLSCSRAMQRTRFAHHFKSKTVSTKHDLPQIALIRFGMRKIQVRKFENKY